MGDVTAAEQALAPFPPERATVRQRVDGVVLHVLITTAHGIGQVLTVHDTGPGTG